MLCEGAACRTCLQERHCTINMNIKSIRSKNDSRSVFYISGLLAGETLYNSYKNKNGLNQTTIEGPFLLLRLWTACRRAIVEQARIATRRRSEQGQADLRYANDSRVSFWALLLYSFSFNTWHPCANLRYALVVGVFCTCNMSLVPVCILDLFGHLCGPQVCW
jgi:hypothetical protein